MIARRGVLLALVGTLLVGSLVVAPAHAKKAPKRCAAFRPSVPQTESPRAAEVPDLPVTRVTDAATEEKPLVLDFDQEAAAWWYAYQTRGPVVDGNKYFNLQVDSDKRLVGLHLRLEWDVPTNDLDLYLFDAFGSVVTGSEAINGAPAEVSGDTGGPGYEYVEGYPAGDCEGFVVEDLAMWTTPQTARLKVWLGPINWE